MNHILSMEIHQAVEVEIRMLGALIFIGESSDIRVKEAMSELHVALFSDPVHREIFLQIRNLFDQDHPFDLISLVDQSSDKAYWFLKTVIGEGFFTANLILSDILTLQDFYNWGSQLKILFNTLNTSSRALIPSDGLEAISTEINKLTQFTSSRRTKNMRTMEKITTDILDNPEPSLELIQTSMPNLPAIPNQSLIAIAGRSGHGKSFFSLYLMDAILRAKPDTQALYFNLEMSEAVMVDRYALLLGAQGESLKDRVKSRLPQLMDRDMSIFTEALMSIEDIEIESRLAFLRKPISVIVVDYLSLVSSRIKYERNDLLQIAIAKKLAGLALSLNCIVLAPMQVNRNSATRPIGDRCPYPSDSSESMGSVHSATWWLGIDQPSKDSTEIKYRNLLQVACRKNRHSDLFDLNLEFKDGKFSSYQRPFKIVEPVHEVD